MKTGDFELIFMTRNGSFEEKLNVQELTERNSYENRQEPLSGSRVPPLIDREEAQSITHNKVFSQTILYRSFTMQIAVISLDRNDLISP